MNPILSDLYNSFIKELQEHQETQTHILDQAKKSVRSGKQVLKAIRDYVIENGFDSREVEIDFFKNIKPLFHCELVYWLEVYQIEAGLPEGSYETKKEYLSRQLVSLELNYSKQITFNYYYRTGETIMDQIYFLRENNTTETYTPSYTDKDPQFSTSHDSAVTRIMADKKLVDYINDRILKLNEIPINKMEALKSQNDLQWTASKAGLVELIYALQCGGVYNNGNADIQKIAQNFEKIFDVDLGNYYNIFNEIRLRKKSRTQLLDQLKEKLMVKIDALDEK